MTVESVDKRERRRVRSERHLNAFKKSVRIFDQPYEALRHVYGIYATWDAVKWVASVELGYWVQDVTLAWQFVAYVKALPDGDERLRAAIEEAVKRWEQAVSS